LAPARMSISVSRASPPRTAQWSAVVPSTSAALALHSQQRRH
jgi:hypothetical protein